MVSRARRILRENGLSITLVGLFAICLAGQALAGHREYNADQREHGEPSIALAEYFGTGHFIEAVFENWESEFLQMGALVVLSAMLYQKGTPDSKKPGAREPVDADPRRSRGAPHVPWPVARGGVALWIYERSLSLALLTLFVLSFVLHAVGGAREYSAEQLAHGGEPVGAAAYVTTSRFWFESFQNWQSEFFSVAVLMILAIVLRQRGSPQSKPVAAPHSETGNDEPPPRTSARRRRRPRGKRSV